jgi:hypothetical protein
MVRTQIQLTEAQAEALRRLAAERGVSMAELVRQSVDDLLRRSDAVDRREVRRRAIAAAGTMNSGIPDLARRHDEYLAEAYDP